MSDIVDLIDPPTDYTDTAVVFMSAGNLRKAKAEIARLRAEVALLKEEKKSMREVSTAGDKEVADMEAEATALRAEVEKLKALLKLQHELREPECHDMDGGGKCMAEKCTCGHGEWHAKQSQLDREMRTALGDTP